MIFLCNPHNPVGRVWTTEELARLGAICRRHGVLVVSDEIHGDITFPGHPYTPFASISDEDALNSITACRRQRASTSPPAALRSRWFPTTPDDGRSKPRTAGLP
jgi:bifunctional pyridoxal-dependent enzyme with beta-cystathionase and maltose regulon repressor activities